MNVRVFLKAGMTVHRNGIPVTLRDDVVVETAVGNLTEIFRAEPEKKPLDHLVALTKEADRLVNEIH